MTDMVVAAAFWRPDGSVGTRDDVLGAPELAHYVSGWPKTGGLGMVAEADQLVGAAWLRHFIVEDPGYGFIDAATPEVSLGVMCQWRGQGIGRRLLEALISAACESALSALSLSVESDNYAVRLYEDLGFKVVTEAPGSITMKLKL